MSGTITDSANGMMWVGNILSAIVIVCLFLAACRDISTRTIPNGVVIIVALASLAARLIVGVSAVGVSIAAALALFLILLILHARGILGGGDAKLIPAIALGLPLPAISHFVFVTVMAGGILGVLHLIGRWAVRGRRPSAPPPRGASLLRRVFSAERWRIARHGSLPYGVAIACGGIWVIMSRAGS